MYAFRTLTGNVYINEKKCVLCEKKPCVAACIPQILMEAKGKIVLAIEEKAAASGKCIECLACELECAVSGNGGLKIDLPIEGL